MDNTGFFVIAIFTVVGFGLVFLYFMLSNIKEEREFKEQIKILCSQKKCNLTIQPEPRVSYMLTGSSGGRNWILKNYTHVETKKFTKGPNDSDLVFSACGLNNSQIFRISDQVTTDTREELHDFLAELADTKGGSEIDNLQKLPFGMTEDFKDEFITYASSETAVADIIDSDVQKVMLRYKESLRRPNFEILSLKDCLIIRSNSTYTLQELEAVLTIGEAILKRLK